MAYLLDTNIFLQSKNLEYRFSFCNDFWQLLIDLHNAGIIFSISSVRNEIFRGNDYLVEWVKTQLPSSFFLNEHDQETLNRYGDLINWVNNSGLYNPNIIKVFANHEHADTWLIAYAAAHQMSIITHETIKRPNRNTKVQIPEAAQVLNVPCVSLYDFLEQNACGTFQMKP
ncbi:MAG: DUF4411 family protein [Neisseriaceae bacterium]|nr:DUF4411 family protein [Neisseriaceae bacterium]